MLVEPLGEGGMGVVWRARQGSLEREVAIKLVRNGAGPRAAEGLLAEARIMGRLQHPNIVPVHALGLDRDGKPALVMKRIEGVAWRAVIADPVHEWWEGADPQARTARNVEILGALCRAVEYAHDRGVLHRDLKPDNVMLGAHGEVWLLDWGVACSKDSHRRGVVGTPAYMAPEQLDMTLPLGDHTDVYLLGSSLHEALTGQCRHRGADLEAVMRSVHESAPHVYPRDIPDELAAIANRACHRDAVQRYARVADLRQALTDWLAHRGALALGDAAREQLDAARALISVQGARLLIDEHLAEARFGYRQALAAWPGNPAFAIGVREVALVAAERSLAIEDPDGAAARIDDLEAAGGDPEPLRARLRALQHEALTRRALANNHDPRLGEHGRWRAMALLGVFFAVTTVLIIGWIGPDANEYSRRTAVAVSAGMTVVMAAGALGIWRRIARTSLNRGILLAAIAAAVAVTTNRGQALLADTPPPTMLSTDLLLIAVCMAVLAAASDPRMLAAAIPLALGSFATLLFPSVGILVFGGSIAFSYLFATLVMRPGGLAR